jgi:hypothetical protein
MKTAYKWVKLAYKFRTNLGFGGCLLSKMPAQPRRSLLLTPDTKKTSLPEYETAFFRDSFAGHRFGLCRLF